MGHAGLVEVALDDAASRPEGRSRPASGGRALRWLAAGAVVLLAGAVLIDGHRTSAVAGRLAGAVALSRPLDAPWQQAWSVEATAVLGPVGDLALVTERHGARLTAIDLADGSVRWQVARPVDPGWCVLVGTRHGRSTGDAGVVLVCARASSAALVTVLDPADGTQRAELVWPGLLTVVEPVGADLVLAGAQVGGDPAARRWNPAAGFVWAFRGAVGSPTGWTLADGVLAAGGTVLDLATGVPAADGPRPGAAEVTAGDSGAVELDLAVAGGTMTRYGPDGTPVWRVEVPVPAGVRLAPLLAVDGTLVVSAGSTVVVLDAADGRLLWSAPTGLAHAATVVTDGARLAYPVRDEAGTALVVADPWTGAQAWRLGLADGPVARLSLTADGDLVVATADGAALLRPAQISARRAAR